MKRWVACSHRGLFWCFVDPDENVQPMTLRISVWWSAYWKCWIAYDLSTVRANFEYPQAAARWALKS